MRLAPADGARGALLPPHRLVSGAPAEALVELSQDLPLYLQNAWVWTLTAAWAPVPSEDVAPLLEVGDPVALAALEDLGLSVVHARVELAR